MDLICFYTAAPDFMTREDRLWLRKLMELEGGPFVDLFRVYHPKRSDANSVHQA